MVITSSVVRIYARYDGDGDAFARSGREHEREIVPDGAWHELDRLIQALVLCKRGLASEPFASETRAALRAATADSEALESIDQLASRAASLRAV